MLRETRDYETNKGDLSLKTNNRWNQRYHSLRIILVKSQNRILAGNRPVPQKKELTHCLEFW